MTSTDGGEYVPRSLALWILILSSLLSVAPLSVLAQSDGDRDALAMRYCIRAVAEFVGLPDLNPLPSGGTLEQGEGTYEGRPAVITQSVFEFRDGRKSVAMCEFAWLKNGDYVHDQPGLVTMHVDGREPDPITMARIGLRLLTRE
jgi:hypothetical protein